ACDNIWTKIALRAVGNLDALRKATTDLKLDDNLERAKQSAINSITTTADLRGVSAFAAIERQLWPAKLIEPSLPTFIVSILPQWAQHFFDVELGSQLLFAYREDLHFGAGAASS